ncbi:MAG TPA: hypothetical protein VGK20_03360 [Candidatus Binatia bacterium]
MKSRSLRVFAVLFGLLALSDLTKPLEMKPEHGLVFLGRRLHGTPDLVIAPLFAVYLGIYAWGLWGSRRFALPMGILYAGWVPLNMYLFTVRSPEELGTNSLFGVTYMILATTVSLGAAFALLRAAPQLR